MTCASLGSFLSSSCAAPHAFTPRNQGTGVSYNVLPADFPATRRLKMSKRQQYARPFKAKETLEAVEAEKTISKLAGRFGVHPTMIHQWKRALLDGKSGAFRQGSRSGPADERTEPGLTPVRTCSTTLKCSTIQSVSTRETGCCPRPTSNGGRTPRPRVSRKLVAVHRRAGVKCYFSKFATTASSCSVNVGLMHTGAPSNRSPRPEREPCPV